MRMGAARPRPSPPTGLVMLPYAVGSIVTSGIGVALAAKAGRALLITGSLVAGKNVRELKHASTGLPGVVAGVAPCMPSGALSCSPTREREGGWRSWCFLSWCWLRVRSCSVAGTRVIATFDRDGRAGSG